MTDWNLRFTTWAQPPGETEQEKIERSVSAVRKALDKDEFLRNNSKVYVQGSYRNRVNVRQESDVDIGVLYTGDSFYGEYPDGTTSGDFGLGDGDLSYAEFKDRIGRALTNHFGSAFVHRGSKAFDIHANTYRIDADVVPVFEHRRYNKSAGYICGVQLNPDDGGKIINWPERLFDNANWPSQHYENAVAKNTRTNRSYKGAVRILKTLRNLMDDEGIPAAKPIKGFLVECMVWNAPDPYFANSTWDQDMQSILAHLWSNTRDDEDCQEWGEVSELKYLFKNQSKKRAGAHAFIDAAWDYIGVRP